MKFSSFFVSMTVISSIFLASQGCTLFDGAEASSEEKLCVPGSYVFCRCADRTPGTKLCKADARSFEACSTGIDGECVGGEIYDPRSNEPLLPNGEFFPDDDEFEEPSERSNSIDACPGRSTAIVPGVELQLTGDTRTATADRKGRTGACAVGAGGNDHIYRLIPSGSGSLEVKVQGSDGLDPVAYIRTSCDDEETQVSCAPPSATKLAQLKLNVVTGREYFLVIDGSSSTEGNYEATLKLTTGSFCGDGKTDKNEACDDGNKVEGDGCSNNCQNISGNPESGGSCPGQPVHVWPGKRVTGTGSTVPYGNSWASPDATCDMSGSNNYSDHIYEVTPHATGNLVVTLSPGEGALPNFMLSARRTCTSAASMSANMCENASGAGFGETLSFPVESGRKVYVAVDGGGGVNNEGGYTIRFEIQ